MFQFETLGAVKTADMRAEVRLYPRMPASHGVWTAPTDILTFRFSPGNRVWTRPISRRADFVRGGQLTFRPRSASWETKSNGLPVLCVMASFDAPMLAAEAREVEACSIEDLAMIEMMRLLHDEIRTPSFASAAMVESISELLRIKLARLTKAPSDVQVESGAFGKTDIALIHDYIEAQSGRSPSVTELANLFNMSRRNLLRRFRNTTAMTVAGYITQVQLTKAKRLLATSNKLIKQVAHETGFKSPSNFAVAFERNVGLTPTTFRNVALGASRSRGV